LYVLGNGPAFFLLVFAPRVNGNLIRVTAGLGLEPEQKNRRAEMNGVCFRRLLRWVDFFA
jgi:hypothetical protein